MSDLRTAAKQALEAWDTRAGIDAASKAFEALRAALTESEQPTKKDLQIMQTIWGARCEEFDGGCAACQAWRLFDTYKSPPNDEDVFALTQQGSLASPES